MRLIGVTLAILLIVGVAVWVRVPSLSERPMHPDEAVQAMRTLHLLESGEFDYDPSDLHGPTLYYLAAAVCWMADRTEPSQVTEALLRGLPLAAGLLVVLLPWLVPGLDVVGRLTASGLLATCSAMAFYSTMFFHEMLHVLFCWGFVIAMLRAWKAGGTARQGWLVALGVLLGLAIATKETWVLLAGALVVGVGTAVFLMQANLAQMRSVCTTGRMVAVGAPALVLALLFFTGFLREPGDVWKPFAAPFAYMDKLDGVSSAGDHAHGPLFFLTRLTWHSSSTAPSWFLAAPLVGALLGLPMAGMLLRRGDHSVRGIWVIGSTAWTLLLLHLVITYKTPWLLLTPLLGFCVLSGFVAQWLWRWLDPWRGGRAALVALLLASGMMLAWQAHQTTGRWASDLRNPWVYSAASADVLVLDARLAEAMACAGPNARVDVVATDYWPLPWYLRTRPLAAYWAGEMPTSPARIVLLNVDQEGEFGAALLAAGYERQYFGLRNEVPVALYLDAGVMSCLRELWSGRRAE
jgi:uncharacterized protein (TIGR03663 family)